MDAIVAMPEITANKLINTFWTFGIPGQHPNSDKFCFTAAGLIAFYASPNEVSWTLDDGQLVIYRTDGSVMWRSMACDIGPAGMPVVWGIAAPYVPSDARRSTDARSSRQASPARR